MQVEVSVQDHFYESSQLESSNLELDHYHEDGMSKKHAPSAIAAETWETWFCRWLEFLHPDIPPAPSYELSLRLTNDAEIQELNTQYRYQNQPTDVLAFAALEVDCPNPTQMQLSLPLYLGDIVISVDTADRQAQHQGHGLQIELAWLAAHGLLHLLGWDHPDEDSLTRMLSEQVILLQTVGLASKTV